MPQIIIDSVKDVDLYELILEQLAPAPTPKPRQPAAAVVETDEVDPNKTDKNGVPYNPAFCSSGNNPFNADGTWTKRRGVDKLAFDTWYKSQQQQPQQQEPVDASRAFGGQTQQRPVPTTAGEYLTFVSEMQAAGRISQMDVNDAYTQNNMALADLFPPNDPGLIQSRIAALYFYLVNTKGL